MATPSFPVELFQVVILTKTDKYKKKEKLNLNFSMSTQPLEERIVPRGNSLQISSQMNLVRYVGILHGAGYVLQEGIAPEMIEQQLRDLAAADFPTTNGYLPSCLRVAASEDKISFINELFFDLSSTSRAGHIVPLDTTGKEGNALLASYLGGFASAYQNPGFVREYTQRLQDTTFAIFRQLPRTLDKP